MGQKINPIIFRLGIYKNWKTEFFEKKICELPYYFFNVLEIENFVNRFLESQQLILHNYKSHQTNSTLIIYISYFVTNKHNNNKISLNKKNILNNKKNFYTVFKNYDLYSLKNYTVFQKLHNKKTITNLKIEQTLNKFFKILSLFTKNNCFMIVNFCCINKNLNFLKKIQKQQFVLFQKFKKTIFLRNGIELLFLVVHTQNSAKLLAKFIEIQIKNEKRHNFFLLFIKQILLILLNSKFSKTKGSAGAGANITPFFAIPKK